ncbi:restriction endonuclease subunit S, partial [bacterium]|nr:restriction endonuclease subunit S [bacterium]
MKSNFIALSDWKQVRLEDLSYDFVSGGTPSTSKIQYWGGDIHWMRSAHISGKEVFSGEKLITKNGLENSATNIVPKDNLLIATRVSLGNVVINRVDMAISQDLTGIILHKEKTDENFLYYLLKTKENEILSIAQGTTIKGILRDDLKKIRISLPPLNEQRGIVEVLGTVDECIRLTDAVIERAEMLKRGLMQQLLTRG